LGFVSCGSGHIGATLIKTANIASVLKESEEKKKNARPHCRKFQRRHIVGQERDATPITPRDTKTHRLAGEVVEAVVAQREPALVPRLVAAALLDQPPVPLRVDERQALPGRVFGQAERRLADALVKRL
jgi:hypothetical protein